MEIRKVSALSAAAALVLAVSVQAQNLRVPEPDNGRLAASAGEIPGRGMSMADVEARFGAPQRRKSPVGDPPITRWEYDGFVVYFEYKHVIHSVRRR